MMEPVAYLREAGFRSLAEGCHTSAMPTDVDEYNIPVIRLSDAEARIAELERELDEALAGNVVPSSIWMRQMELTREAEARAEAAEAMIIPDDKLSRDLVKYAVQRGRNLAARSISAKIGGKDE